MKIDKEKMTPKKKTTTLEVMMKRNRKETMKTENETEIKEIIKKFEGIGAQMKTGKKITIDAEHFFSRKGRKKISTIRRP